MTRAGYVPTAASLLPAQLYLAAFVACDGAYPAWAQTGASVSGAVTDQAGAALPDVAVTIKNVDAGAAFTIATDGGRRYQASGLLADRFAIRAAKRCAHAVQGDQKFACS